MAILSKVCKPNNFESHNSPKLSFTNVRGLCSNFVNCESFLESNSPDILALCETNLDYSIDSVIFSVRGYLPLILKYSATHARSTIMDCLTVYVKGGLAFSRGLNLEKLCRFLLMFSTGFTSSVSFFLFLCQSPFLSLWTVFDSVS